MSERRCIRPSIFLEYGVDAVCAVDADCEICERGMRFNAQWRFCPGALLQISFAFEEGTPERLDLDALVIESDGIKNGKFRTTLVFVDPPHELRSSLHRISTPLKLHQPPQ